MTWRNLSAAHVTASVIGVLAGLAGMEHGFFETLQGNIAPDAIRIHAIGLANQYWSSGGEPAMTLIPNFLVTGLLAMLVSLVMIGWAACMLHKKHAWLVLLVLAIAQLLVGGGFAPPILAMLACLPAAWIHHPWNGWRTHLPGLLTRSLAKLWPLVFPVFLVAYLFSIELAIFGFAFGLSDPRSVLYAFAWIIPSLCLLTILTGFARDLQNAFIQR